MKRTKIGCENPSPGFSFFIHFPSVSPFTTLVVGEFDLSLGAEFLNKSDLQVYIKYVKKIKFVKTNHIDLALSDFGNFSVRFGELLAPFNGEEFSAESFADEACKFSLSFCFEVCSMKFEGEAEDVLSG